MMLMRRCFCLFADGAPHAYARVARCALCCALAALRYDWRALQVGAPLTPCCRFFQLIFAPVYFDAVADAAADITFYAIYMLALR